MPFVTNLLKLDVKCISLNFSLLSSSVMVVCYLHVVVIAVSTFIGDEHGENNNKPKNNHLNKEYNCYKCYAEQTSTPNNNQQQKHTHKEKVLQTTNNSKTNTTYPTKKNTNNKHKSSKYNNKE